MKVLSINLWNINEPLEARMKNLSVFLEVEVPDVICFQEISPHNGVPQIDYLLNKNGYTYMYKKSGIWQGREEGLAIATKQRLVNISSLYLPNNDTWQDMQRLLVSADIIIEDQKITFYNTHLAYHLNSEIARRIQVNKIIEHIKNEKSIDDLIILCGDFNEDPNVSNIYPMIINDSLGFRDSWEGNAYTFSSCNSYVEKRLWPDRRIDYIFHSPNLTFKSKAAMTETDGFHICSDHYGVIAHGGMK